MLGCTGVPKLLSVPIPFLSIHPPSPTWLKTQKEPNWESRGHILGIIVVLVILLSSGAFISKTLMTFCHVLLKRRGKLPLTAVFIMISDFLKMFAVKQWCIFGTSFRACLLAAFNVSGNFCAQEIEKCLQLLWV